MRSFVSHRVTENFQVLFPYSLHPCPLPRLLFPPFSDPPPLSHTMQLEPLYKLCLRTLIGLGADTGMPSGFSFLQFHFSVPDSLHDELVGIVREERGTSLELILFSQSKFVFIFFSFFFVRC